MRKQLRKLLWEAKRVRKNGETGTELFALREAQYGQRMAEVQSQLVKIRAFQTIDWATDHRDGRRLQATHKQRPATDADLVAFYAKVAPDSKYRVPFLIAEFSGCRGQEFAEGVRVEVSKKGAVPFLQFFIASAKCDQNMKGIDLRSLVVPFPLLASKPVQRRWMELAKKVAADRPFVSRIEREGKQSVGQLFTGACKDVSDVAGVHVAAYSLRNRYSAQVKQANGGDAVAVALAMGHQTTETQRHYARANRGRGGVSPVESSGVNLGGVMVRGPAKRRGPGLHVSERAILRKVGAPIVARANPRRGLRL